MELLSPDMPIAELCRQMLAAQLAIIQTHLPVLQQMPEITPALSADATSVVEVAVHESRKAIRRTYTAVRIFHPYFEPGLLDCYRKRLRKLMKRLAPCRDTAVFLDKLQLFAAESGAGLAELIVYWQGQLTAVDDSLQQFVNRKKWAAFWPEYAEFTGTAGRGVLAQPEFTPVKAGHLIPGLLYERVAGVRAFDDYGRSPHTAADIHQMHQIRIQCKELRYAFEFFSPLLGPEIEPVIVVLEQLQDNLGALNDARVALEMLANVTGMETAVARYRQAKEAEIERLLAEFPPLWEALNGAEWRRNLALALAVL
ncbi:MAG: CHAD domain-containing protein [Ardenticatenaceae bacterium]|nr:CHAD domain-containing protein [Ardenticatenaceae bacterium]MCB9446317.1 CHAD domain-containing protein [Ardenticatenaceae bacterium]